MLFSALVEAGETRTSRRLHLPLNLSGRVTRDIGNTSPMRCEEQTRGGPMSQLASRPRGLTRKTPLGLLDT